MSNKQAAVALFCFGGEKAAAKARKPFEDKLRAGGHTVLQTTILKVNAKHAASVHDARRVLAGLLTSALTWGLFGLIAGTNRVESAVIWAVLGAICGGAYAYFSEHVLTKSELARIGASLDPSSSALVIAAETSDPGQLLHASAAYAPSAASVAVIAPDLTARVFAGAEAAIELPHGAPGGAITVTHTAVVSMLLFRYPDPKTAASVAGSVTKTTSNGGGPLQIELVIENDGHGHRHVTDPARGTAAMARSDVVSWGAFGVVFGAVVGATGGGGILGFLEGGVVTGIAWAVFGLVAGMLYGLWAGRSVSAHRLKGIGPLLAPGTSVVLGWANGAPEAGDLELLARPGSEHLALMFNAVEHGAVLEAV